MLLAIIRYLQGYLHIRITGYSPERFLNLCSYRKLYLWGLEPQKNSYDMYITVKEFRKLKPIIRKTGTKVTIVKRIGLPFFFHKYKRRKLFFGGAFLCIVMVYILSLFVWEVEITGNITRTDETILEFLQTTKVKHGMWKKNVDCERIVKDIRKEFDDIIWVSAHVQGAKLYIHVKENTDTFLTDVVTQDESSDIVAKKNGVITEIITRQGVPLVKVGDEVKEGDILVTGQVDILNDSGEVVNSHYLDSDADIIAKTNVKYKEKLEFVHYEKKYMKSNRYGIYFKLGNSMFNLGYMKHKYDEWEQYTSEKQFKIGPQFYLPFAVGIRKISQYQSVERVYTKKEMQRLLSKQFKDYCDDLKTNGIIILENHVEIYLHQKYGEAKGTLILQESIGKRSVIKIDF